MRISKTFQSPLAQISKTTKAKFMDLKHSTYIYQCKMPAGAAAGNDTRTLTTCTVVTII
jgi:hypothetical protein